MHTSTIEKMWVQNAVYVSNDRNWSFLLLRLLRFFIRFCFSLSSFSSFFGFVNFVTTTPDKFQFPSQVGLSQVSVVVPIRLKLELYAVLIEWGSRKSFLFVGQDIVNNWDFPSRISINCHKRLLPKVARYDLWELLVKMSLRDQLVCFAAFVGMTLLAVFFLLPLPNCFSKVCLPLFAAVLKFFLPLTTSGISGAANSNKSAPTRFAAGKMDSRKNGIAVFPITESRRCLPIPL